MKHLFVIFLFSIGLIGCESTTTENEPTPAAAELPMVPEKIQFPSLDGLSITANLYDRGSEYPVIVLCHQARFNKVEYSKIAMTLFDMGYNCLAIDQRSGGHIVESFNETLLEANKAGVPVEYADAEQDILAAINFAANKYDQDPILWGSSYSSTLALHIASENEKLKAVIAFSPGSYLDEQKGTLKEKLAGVATPMFVTSSKKEAPDVTALLEEISLGEKQLQFIPESEGRHGSKALWETDEYHEEYWEAITEFLNELSDKK